MRKLPSHLTAIDPRETTFFYFKLDATTHILYDSDMGEPVAYGSFNLVGTTITKLPKQSMVFYFEMDTNKGWRLVKTYKPTKELVPAIDRKENIDEKKKR